MTDHEREYLLMVTELLMGMTKNMASLTENLAKYLNNEKESEKARTSEQCRLVPKFESSGSSDYSTKFG
jgi:hypothetical protein